MSEEQTEIIETPAVEVSPSEAQARERGWVSLEEWQEQGKDADDWITHKHFNERGQWIEERRGFHNREKNFNERLANNNVMWQATLDDRIAQLQADKKEAIKLADDETVEKIDQQIDAAKVEKQQAQQGATPPASDPADIAHENQWLAANASWYNANSGKGAFARAQVQTCVNEGLNGKALTDEVERRVAKEFPTVNPNRDKQVTDKSTPPASSKGNKVASIDQLKSENARIAQSLKNRGMSDKQILQMVNDKEKS